MGITNPITHPTTTAKPTTTVEPPTTTEEPTTTTEEPTTTTEKTTIKPTPPPTPSQSGFDAWSFVGGILITVGLSAIIYVSIKYYRSRMNHEAYERIDSQVV